MPWEGPHSGPKIKTENWISDFQLTSLQDPTPLYPSPFALCLFLCTSSSSKPFSVLGVLALVVLLNGHWALWLVLYKLRKTILKWITSSYIRKKCSLALHNMTACSGWSPRLLLWVMEKCWVCDYDVHAVAIICQILCHWPPLCGWYFVHGSPWCHPIRFFSMQDFNPELGSETQCVTDNGPLWGIYFGHHSKKSWLHWVKRCVFPFCDSR